MPVDGRPLVLGEELPGQPDPAQPSEQLGMWARREQMCMQDRVHLILDPRAMPDHLVAPGHEPAPAFGLWHRAARSPGRKSAARSDASTPASILSVLTCACAIALTCSG